MSLDKWIELIQSAPLAFSLFFGLVILTIFQGVKKRKTILNGIKWYTDYKVKNKEYKEMLLNDHKKMAEYEQNRIHDREQSFAIQKQLVDAQTKLAEQISDIAQKIDNNQKLTDERFAKSEERQNKRVRAELKDKIMRAYRLHHKTKRITAMELDALEGLIDEYFAVNGNSFVQNVIQPEMYTWEVADEFE